MGRVYEAVDETLGRTVALKVVRPGRGPGFSEKILAEARMLAGLAPHPNIAQVYHADIAALSPDDPGSPFFAMEHVPGRKNIVEFAASRRLSPHARLELIAKVCDTVHYLHEHGIIHRDLKPSNILISTGKRREPVPKVIDLGVGLPLHRRDQAGELGHFVGTPAYASPEQFEADPASLDGRSDVYSLGVVLFELLCGRLPYETHSTNLFTMRRAVTHDPPLRPGDVVRGMDSRVQRIIMKSLEKDPARRFQSAEELAKAIRDYLASAPVYVRYPAWCHAAVVCIVSALLFGLPPISNAWLKLLNPVTAWFERSMIALIPPVRDYSDVRVIALTHETPIAQLAAAEGLPDVDPAVPTSLRMLHGKLMEKLAPARPGVMVWDIRFRAAPPGMSDGPADDQLAAFDEGFLAGVNALKAVGVPVVCASLEWVRNDRGLPADVSPRIAREVIPGVATIQVADNAPWRAPLIGVHEGDRAVLGLGMAAAMAKIRPEAEIVEAILDPEGASARVNFWTANPEARGALIRAGDPITLQGLYVMPESADDELYKVSAGAMFAQIMLTIPPNEVLESITFKYEDIFSANPERLEAIFGGKAVMVGDFRPRAEYSIYPDGRDVAKPYAHADAIAGVLATVSPPAPMWLNQALTPALLAAAGVLIAIASRGRLIYWLTGVVLLCMMSLAALVWLYVEFGYLLTPAVPTLAIVLAGFGGLVIVRLIERHHSSWEAAS